MLNRRRMLATAVAAMAYPVYGAFAQPAPPVRPPMPPPRHKIRPPPPPGHRQWYWSRGRWRWNGRRLGLELWELERAALKFSVLQPAGGVAAASAVRRASSLLSSKEVRITVPPSPCKAASTLSVVILRTSRKSVALPDCRLCAASRMNLSLMPTSASAPPRTGGRADRRTSQWHQKDHADQSAPEGPRDGAGRGRIE